MRLNKFHFENTFHLITLSNTKTIFFFRFLRPDHECRETWIEFVQKNRNEDTWLPSNHSYICSEHFRDCDKYITKAGRIYLKKFAVPYEKVYDKESSLEGIAEPLEPVPDTLSDLESIFDSPSKIALKRKLSKVITAKNKLAIKFKKIQLQNKYLKKKCEFYKSVIENLNEKFVFITYVDNVDNQ